MAEHYILYTLISKDFNLIKENKGKNYSTGIWLFVGRSISLRHGNLGGFVVRSLRFICVSFTSAGCLLSK